MCNSAFAYSYLYENRAHIVHLALLNNVWQDSIFG